MLEAQIFRIMKTKLLPFLFLYVFFGGFSISAQERAERQHRIKKSQFPSKASEVIAQNSADIKRLKFYREIDSAQKTYTAKFKKSRLFYEMDFDKNGEFKSMGFNVKQIDIPEESFEQIRNYLSQNFEKSKIRRMLQLYHAGEENNLEKTIKNAFQNLMTPNMLYKLLVRGKNDGKSTDCIVIFDAEGNFREIRESLPANRDRVLY